MSAGHWRSCSRCRAGTTTSNVGLEGLVEVEAIENLDLDFAESAFDTDDLDDMVGRVEEIYLNEDWEPEAAEGEEPSEEAAP